MGVDVGGFWILLLLYFIYVVVPPKSTVPVPFTPTKDIGRRKAIKCFGGGGGGERRLTQINDKREQTTSYRYTNFGDFS